MAKSEVAYRYRDSWSYELRLSIRYIDPVGSKV